MRRHRSDERAAVLRASSGRGDRAPRAVPGATERCRARPTSDCAECSAAGCATAVCAPRVRRATPGERWARRPWGGGPAGPTRRRGERRRRAEDEHGRPKAQRGKSNRDPVREPGVRASVILTRRCPRDAGRKHRRSTPADAPDLPGGGMVGPPTWSSRLGRRPGLQSAGDHMRGHRRGDDDRQAERQRRRRCDVEHEQRSGQGADGEGDQGQGPTQDFRPANRCRARSRRP